MNEHTAGKKTHSSTCVYHGCGARSRDCIPNLRFHGLPIKDKDRLVAWLANSGREDLAEESDANLRKLAICGLHFSEKDVFPATGWLKTSALPLVFTPDYEEDSDELPSYENWKRMDHSRNLMRKDLTEQQRINIKLRQKNDNLRKLLKTKNQKLNRLTECMNNGNISDDTLMKALCRRVRGFVLTFICMQLFHKSGTTFTEDQKKLSMKIHYTSPSLYSKMRDDLGFTLPSLSIIKEWFSLIRLWPGICSTVFQALKSKALAMNSIDKHCVLIFDEIKLKKGLDFHETIQKIEGYEDLGNLGCSPKIACSSMVFMVRGLFSNWKQPIAYVLSAQQSLSADILDPLLDTVLNAVVETGLKVRAIVCDQNPSNQSVVKKKMTNREPWFILHGFKIYILFDIVHLFKSIRNQLILHDVMVETNVKVSWVDVVLLWKLEKDASTRATCKLTERHVHPQLFDKMKCRLALQVMSRQVSAALYTAATTGQIATDTVMNTANFFSVLNDLFDNLNSRSATDPNINKCALSRFRPNIEENLVEGLKQCSNWRTITKQGLKVPPCFEGLQASIAAILQLWKDIQEEGITFLLTARLNQDPLENLFSMIRTYGGTFNPNPTPKNFRLILQKNMTLNLLRPPRNANCVDDEDEILVQSTISELRQSHKNLASAIDTMLNQRRCSSEVIVSEHRDEEFVDSILLDMDESPEDSLEVCATEYFAGYIARRCVQRTECKRCTETCLDTNRQLERSEQILIYFRAYETADGAELGHLCVPTKEFSFIFKILNAVFDNLFPSVKGNYGFLDAIYDIMVSAVHKARPNWFEDEVCKEHRRCMAYDMMTVKVRKITKWQSCAERESKARTLKKNQKMTNLQSR